MATDLYHRTMNFNYGDDERAELMHKVWDGFPWMVNAYTGGYSRGRDREHDILTWCCDNIGEPASPIHDRPGPLVSRQRDYRRLDVYGLCVKGRYGEVYRALAGPRGGSAVLSRDRP